MLKEPYSFHEISSLQEDIIEFLTSGPVTICIYLTNRAKTCDVSQNFVFQKVFKRYYGLNGAGVTPEFVDAFFRELESAKTQGFEPRTIARNLRNFPNRKGQESLQFSFITKIGATLNPKLPIYDSRIIDLLGFPNRKTIRDYDQRLERYLEDYTRLKLQLPKIGNERSIVKISEALRQENSPEGSTLPEERICDLILWAYHQLKPRSGGIKDGFDFRARSEM